MAMTIPELDPDPERETPNEWTTVERPLLQQLAAMGWEYLEGDLDYPQKTFRENFRDVLLHDHLRAAVKRINNEANLDDITIDRAIRELERSEKSHGLDRNRELTEKLIKGVQVPRANSFDPGHSRNVSVKFIDFHPAYQGNNRFVAINQFRIDTIGRVGFVIPDVPQTSVISEQKPAISGYCVLDEIHGVEDSVFYIVRPKADALGTVYAADFGFSAANLDNYTAFAAIINYCREHPRTRVVFAPGDYAFNTDAGFGLDSLSFEISEEIYWRLGGGLGAESTTPLGTTGHSP